MSIMVNAKFETYLPQSIWCYLPPSNYGFRAVKLNLYFCIMSELKKKITYLSLDWPSPVVQYITISFRVQSTGPEVQ